MNTPACSKGMIMSVPKKILSSLYDPARGLIALPAILICTYGLLCFLIYLECLCAMRSDLIFEFWSLPRFAGLSLLDLFTLTNVLFFGYLLDFAWSFVSDKRRRSKRTVLFLGTLLSLISLLAGLQVYQTKVRALFGLPEEILSLRTEQFHDYHGRELEDLILPKSDMCEGISRPFEPRCTISIQRPGHFIRNRRNLGLVSDAHDEIRSLLIEETSLHPREPDGASKLILLIRADREGEFWPIHEVMELCNEKEIGIYRIEFTCLCDLRRRVPEAAEKLNWYYALPEGKLDAYLPHSVKEQDSITVDILADEGSEESFLCRVNGQNIEGPDLPRSFCNALENLQSRNGKCEIVMRVQESIEYGHVIALLTECHRTGAKRVAFEILQDV